MEDLLVEERGKLLHQIEELVFISKATDKFMSLLNF